MATREIIGSYETTLICMNYSAPYEKLKLTPSLYPNLCLRTSIYTMVKVRVIWKTFLDGCPVTLP